MINKIKKIIKKPFIRNVTILASGTAVAQAITMVLSPIITRLYGPEAFGLMGTFNSIISIVAPVAALTYPIAIVLPKNDQDAKGLIRLSLFINGIISVVSLFILILLNNHIINIFNLRDISPYLYLIPLVIVFAGLSEVAEQWLIRTKQFAINARATLLQSFIINGSKAGLGFFYPFAPVLVVLTALAKGLRAALMIVFAKRSNYLETNISNKKKKSLKELARRYYDFPLFRAPESFLSAVSRGSPVLMLTAFFGPESAGFFTIGRTVLRMPSRLIGKSVGDVFYPRIAEAANKKENVTALIKKATLALACVGILPFGLVILFGPFLFNLIFGSDWVTAGEYARWIALWSFSGFINLAGVRSLPVLFAQKFHLIYTIVMVFVRLGALAIGYYVFSSDLVAIAMFGISSAILNLVLILITLEISRRRREC